MKTKKAFRVKFALDDEINFCSCDVISYDAIEAIQKAKESLKDYKKIYPVTVELLSSEIVI